MGTLPASTRQDAPFRKHGRREGKSEARTKHGERAFRRTRVSG